MSRTVGGVDADSLERSSSRRADSIRFGPKAYGVERAEVYLSTCAFSPHRHDTYAIGVTTAGVQTFGYRGSRCVCLPGQLHVLHPDEAHDGAAGTEDGFSYRILYIAPELIRGALAGRALPFVADPVQEPTPAVRPIAPLLADIDDPISELSCAEIAVAVADCLLSLSGRPDRRRATIDLRAVELVRDHGAANAAIIDKVAHWLNIPCRCPVRRGARRSCCGTRHSRPARHGAAHLAGGCVRDVERRELCRSGLRGRRGARARCPVRCWRWRRRC
jgi:hypothetical protein